MPNHHGMRLTRRQALEGLVAAGAATALPAIAWAAPGEVVVCQSTDVLTLDPSTDSSSIGINVFINIFDSLSEIRADGSVGPQLASSWESNDDQTVWTFTLREGVKFHDGSTLTIDDVLWTYNKIRADAKSPVRAYLSVVKEMERLDARRVRFTLKSSFVTFPRQVSLVYILPQKAYEALGPQKFSLTPVGTGPFKVVRWVKDQAVELAANPDHWAGAPTIKKLTFRPVPSEASRAAALQSGELDVVPLLPPSLVDALSTKPGLKVERVKSNRVVYLGFNPATAPLGDVRIRKAIDHAIDRTALTQKLLRGGGEPVGQIPAPVLFGHDPAIKPTTYDPELSKRLLKEAGYKGEKIVFSYPSNRWAFAEQTAQAIGGYMTAVGLAVELKGMEFSAFFPLWTGDKLTSMYMFSLGITVMDADLILNLEYETGTSHGYWKNPRVDELIKLQRAEKDPAKRKAFMSEIWKISQENVPFAPLYNEIQAYGLRDGVTWTPRPDERLKFKDAKRA